MRTSLQMFARSASESRYPQLWRGLVGAWCPSLGPTGEKLRDWSGRANHGTLTSLTLANSWVLNQGHCLSFDASGHVAFDSTSLFAFIQNTGKFAISLWLRMSSTGATQYFMGNTPTASEKGFYYGVNSTGKMELAICNGSGSFVINSLSTSAIINDTNWHHVVVNGNGTTLTFWVDRRSDAGTGTMGSFSSGGSTRAMHFGDINNYVPEKFGDGPWIKHPADSLSPCHYGSYVT